jgi:ribonuclease HII
MLRAGAVTVAGMDEVGRGAPAGPVSCGVVVVDGSVGRVPAGLRDSKLLTPAAREALVPVIVRWARAWAVGHASAGEVDEHGVVGALRLAGHRALAQLEVPVGAMLLDGNLDWLRWPDPRPDGGAADDEGAPGRQDGPGAEETGASIPPVTTRIGADRTCASVAAASVLAKVARDARMAALALAHPGYGWERNKGYGSPDHLAAIGRLGLTGQHRRTWRTAHLDPAAPPPG